MTARLALRSLLLLAGSAAVMAVGLIVTHHAVPADADHAERAPDAVMSIVPSLVGVLGALIFLAGARVFRRGPLGPAWYLLLPPIAFLFTEAVERGFGVEMPEPSSLATLVVQIPFALIAYALARILRAVVRRVARFLDTRAVVPRLRPAPSPRLAWAESLLTLPSASGTHLGRAPPIPG